MVKIGPLYTFRVMPVIARMLAQRGVDVTELLREAELPPDALRAELVAPLARIQAFVALAAKRTGSGQFGLELAAELPGGAFGLAEFLVRTAPTIGDGLAILCEFAPLLNPLGVFRFVTTEQGGALHYAVGSERDGAGVHLNEMTIAYIVRQLGGMLGQPLVMDDVWFSHSRREGALELVRWFGCDVRFRAADCGFAASKPQLSRVPRSAEPLLFDFLAGQARAQLARLGPADIVTQVIRVMEARMPARELRAEDIASALAISPRTLQRSLAEAGTTFREVVTHVRRRRRAELQSGQVDEPAIARHLGFSSVRAMLRSLG